jgi:large subunit ribosomal protein L21
MHAVIQTGGKQYSVQEGDIIYIEKLDVKDGDSIVFDRVMAVYEGDSVKIGTPVVDGATVTASVVKNGKGKKIKIFKYKSKKNYRRRQGHRQPSTKVQIGSIKG